MPSWATIGGGRVGHRLALDHPERVERLAVLDIVPTRKVFASIDKRVAVGTYHWFFLSQPFDLPERMIGADPAFFLRWHLRSWSGGRDGFFAPEALAEYERCFSDPATIHGSCEDYRAGATIDLDHDEDDLATQVQCPVLALWGARGKNDELFGVLSSWRERAVDVRGRSLDCGHFLAEEAPDETTDALLAFLLEE